MLSVAESYPRASAVATRRRYARIPEVLDIPNLIELQLSSFDWFVEKGLRELFDEISPIKDFTGKVMELTSWTTSSARRSTPSSSAARRTSPSAARST